MSDENENYHTQKNVFFDLSTETRAYWYNRASEENNGMDFFDLPPECRAEYYERATEIE